VTSADRNTGPASGAPAADRSGIHHHTPHYEIRVDGHLGAHWAAWFDGMSLAHDDDGTTVIRGDVVDQAALHGLIQKLRDLGIALISLTPVPSDLPAPTAAQADATTPPGPMARHIEGN
jgi:hypothetical protein